jgi:hypothetical protein
LTKLEKRLAETSETEGEVETKKVWCYWNGEVVDCEELRKRLLIGGGCESASDLSVSTLTPASLAQVSTSPSASEPSQSKEEIEAYFKRCSHFDWFYSYSDDNNVWRRGEKNFKQLQEDSLQSPLFSSIFTDWREYNFNGESWGTQKPAKPELSAYI